MPTPRLAAAFGLALFISLAVPSAALASDPAPLQGDPTTAFGITDGGVLNMFDIETGRVLSSAGGQTLDADYSTVRGELFWATTKNGQDIINSVPWGSTRPSGVVARGRRVTVSPDGHLLAYSYDPDGPAEGSLPETIAVRNLDTGRERLYTGPAPEGIDQKLAAPLVNDLAISPDSTRLAFDYIGGGEVFLLDLAQDHRLADAEPLDAAVGAHSAAWMDDSTLAFIDTDGVFRMAAFGADGGVGHYVLPGYVEAIDADDSGRLMVKLTPNESDPEGRSLYLMLVNHDGGEFLRADQTVVW